MQETAKSGMNLVIDFTATWCPPCKMIGPIFEEMAKDPAYQSFVFMKCDVDDAKEVARLCEISSMPTFIAYKNGKESGRFSGASQENLE